MSDELEIGREYTWGSGACTYVRDEYGIWCLRDKGHRLSKDRAAEHIKYATSYSKFRYLNDGKAAGRLNVDDVRKPSHYQVFPDVESIEIIARSMTQAEFKGFCLGNVLKYRLRAGKKSELATMEKDLKKADFYKELFEQHKGKCYE
ncbi:nucleotide kinase [Escherichia phage vB_EcoP_PAS7]|uniref:Nucleotide kinase n=1 Tax=Escherichia phage vB_EcoP_PAS7 TaxID=3053875 RepID=A0AA51VID6_9CAUD|nr:nucleotide kinase [Escherichia phage vB_EcoP_PAS7]